jgi:hypothetical protein
LEYVEELAKEAVKCTNDIQTRKRWLSWKANKLPPKRLIDHEK